MPHVLKSAEIHPARHLDLKTHRTQVLQTLLFLKVIGRAGSGGKSLIAPESGRVITVASANHGITQWMGGMAKITMLQESKQHKDGRRLVRMAKILIVGAIAVLRVVMIHVNRDSKHHPKNSHLL
jgi:hypothetical protein